VSESSIPERALHTLIVYITPIDHANAGVERNDPADHTGLLPEAYIRDAGELVGQRNGEHVVVESLLAASIQDLSP
jgi:hypothetical protein